MTSPRGKNGMTVDIRTSLRSHQTADSVSFSSDRFFSYSQQNLSFQPVKLLAQEANISSFDHHIAQTVSDVIINS